MGKLSFKATIAAIAALVLAGAQATAQITESPVRAKMPTNRSVRKLPKRTPAPVEVGTLNKANESFSVKSSKRASGTLPTLYGAMLYSDAWADLGDDDSTPYGVYQLKAGSVINPTGMCLNAELMINGGGCYSDRKIHYRLYFMDSDAGTFYNYYTVVNTDEWYYEVEPILSEIDNTIASDMTYDSTNGKIYAAVWGNYDGTYNRFATVDPLTGATTELSTIPELACLAANNFGEIYGVSLTDGILYKFDKTDGSYVEIGATGVNPKYVQSACVDPATNQIYWAAQNTNDEGLLYTIDTSTGKANLVGRFANNEEFSCLFIEDDIKGLNAPAALSNFSTAYDGTSSRVSFTLPTKAFDGTSLSGSLDVYVYADGVEKVHTTATAGQAVSYEMSLGDGDHSIVAFAQNSAGAGPKTTVRHFAGNDVPGAPQNLNLAITDNCATLTWDAPSTGLNGGQIDASSLKYKIVRYPGGNVCSTGYTGTSFTENLPAGIANYYYTVTSSSAQGEGGTATSNSVFTGSTFEVPYINQFNDAESLLGFTIIDGDGDGYSWEYKHLTPYNTDAQDIVWTRYNSTEQCDDWLILPPIEFNKSNAYQLRFKARVFDSDYPERFEVTIGSAASVEAQTTNILRSTETDSESYVQYSVPFTVAQDGVSYISFHCISSANSYRLLLDDIEITATATSDVPSAVTNLTATPDPDGLSVVTLSFTTPTTTYSGAVLNEIKSVSIFRGESIAPLATIENPGIGKSITWQDTDAPEGTLTYRVICYNTAGQGIEASINTYVGLDTPLAVTNLVAKNVDEEAVITWTAPTKGVSGADLDPSKLTYYVRRNDGTVISEGSSATTATDSYYKDASGQVMCYYQVEAIYGGTKTSDSALSPFILIGPDYTVPFSEGFPYDDEVEGFVFDNLPWVLSRITGHTSTHWTVQSTGIYPTASPADGDGGMATFLAFDLASGDTERLTSPRIDLYNAERPVLTFQMYRTTYDAGEELTVEISHNDGEFETLATIPLKSTVDGWEEQRIEIPHRHCLEQSMISFRVTSARGYNVHIDKIAITNNTEAPDYDLEASDIDVPDMFPDEKASISVTVFNNGANTISDYTIQLLVDGQVAISQDFTDEPIEAGSEMIFTFGLTPEQSDLNQTYTFQGHIYSALDTNHANDYTVERSVVIGQVGITDAAAEHVKVATAAQAITIDGGEGLTASIITPAGISMGAYKLTGHNVIPMSTGIYIVTINGKATKVIVK